MTKDQKKRKHKGAAKYLRYPEKTIYEKIGDRVLEADFVGEKYITGRTEPINFIGYYFKRSPGCVTSKESRARRTSPV